MQDFANGPFTFEPIQESQEYGNINGSSSTEPEGKIEDTNTERFGITLWQVNAHILANKLQTKIVKGV